MSFQRGLKDDLPLAKARITYTELDLWRTKRKSETVKAKLLDMPTKALRFVDMDYIYVILAISTTLPVTSCECEKSISVLKFTAKKGANHILK